jgi:hypothetical protein
MKNGNSFEDPAAEIVSLEFNGAFYEVTDNPDILEGYGLPRTITSEYAGDHLCYLEKDGAGFKQCSDETDIEMYTYAPMPCAGVNIIRTGDEYSAALFCNHINDDSSCIEFSEIYSTYSVESSEDIVSVCEFNGVFGYEKMTNIITDRTVLNDFYKASLLLDSCSSDDFQRLEIEVLPEETQRTARYEELAEDSVKLRIETAAGLVFFIKAYPTYGWLEGDLFYYKFNDSMTEWFSENIER